MATEEIDFDEAEHIYRVAGRRVISVSQVLVEGGLIDPTWFTEEGKERGIAVHSAVNLDLNDDLHFDSLHPLIKPYVEAWLDAKKYLKIIPYLDLCEKKQYHHIYKYCGRPDIVGHIFGNKTNVVIDVKTGAATTARYQLSAYREFPSILCKFPRRFDLRLFKTGKWSFNEYKDPNDFLIFMDLLNKINSRN